MSKNHINLRYWLLVKVKSLIEAEEFVRLKKEGICLSEGGLEIFITAEEAGVSRLGVQVSSKIANSVTRNRVKRRIKEAVRFLEERETFSMLVVVKKEGLRTEVETIVDTLKKHPSL